MPEDQDSAPDPNAGASGNLFPPGLAVRRISPTDNEAVRELFIEAQASLQPEDADLETRIALKRYTDSCLMSDLARASTYYRQPGRNMWLLESQEKELAAMVAVDSDAKEAEPRTALLTRLCVRQDFRRKGVGTLLTRRAEQWAKRQGFTAIRLYVTDLQPEAQSIYSKLEYAQIGTQQYGPIEVLELRKSFMQASENQ